MTRALEIDALRVTYGHITAVDAISLYVGEGEIVAMIGGNGAGKSSIVRAVTGMVRADTGSIRGPGGVDLRRLPPHLVCRTGIALVPSERQIFREMSVRENLAMGAYSLADRAEVARLQDDVLRRFPVLAERLDGTAGNLSGGQQQQLAIGRALMAMPRLLLMDEPSLGLSPAIADQVFALETALNAEGLAILLIEQNAKRALEVSDRAYVLRAGQLVAQGDSAALAVDPAIVEAYLGRLAGRPGTQARA